VCECDIVSYGGQDSIARSSGSRSLHRWQRAFKLKRLSKVQDGAARNLI
jgi:hypothetical protein